MLLAGLPLVGTRATDAQTGADVWLEAVSTATVSVSDRLLSYHFRGGIYVLKDPELLLKPFRKVLSDRSYRLGFVRRLKKTGYSKKLTTDVVEAIALLVIVEAIAFEIKAEFGEQAEAMFRALAPSASIIEYAVTGNIPGLVLANMGIWHSNYVTAAAIATEMRNEAETGTDIYSTISDLSFELAKIEMMVRRGDYDPKHGSQILEVYKALSDQKIALELLAERPDFAVTNYLFTDDDVRFLQSLIWGEIRSR